MLLSQLLKINCIRENLCIFFFLSRRLIVGVSYYCLILRLSTVEAAPPPTVGMQDPIRLVIFSP
jgi:hypothetical protein